MTQVLGRNIWVVGFDYDKNGVDRIEPERFHTYELALERADEYEKLTDSSYVRIDGPFDEHFLRFRLIYERLTEEDFSKIMLRYPDLYSSTNRYYRTGADGNRVAEHMVKSNYTELFNISKRVGALFISLHIDWSL